MVASQRQRQHIAAAYVTAILACLAMVVASTSSSGVMASINNDTNTNTTYSCEPGFYVDDGASDDWTCIACDVGLYQPFAFDAFSGGIIAQCTECDPGSYASTTGSSACALCGVGSYQMYPASSSCVLAEPGGYQDVIGAVLWHLCPVATYQPLPGQSSCFECATATLEGMSWCPSAIQCAAGQYVKQSIDPINGTIIDEHCEACPAGTFSSFANTGATSCSGCKKGRYSEIGSVACTYCNGHTYQPVFGGSTCLACYTASGTGLESCPDTNCAVPGSYLDVATNTCELCQPGRYSFGDYTQTVCDACEHNSSNDQPGSTDCFPCDTPQPLTGATTCDTCERYYHTVDGQLQCATIINVNDTTTTTPFVCPQGSYVADDDFGGALYCHSCYPGRYQKWEWTDARYCTVCDAGTYASNEGSTSCQLCDIGFYNNGGHGDYCAPCPTATSPGSTSCDLSSVSCPSGTYLSTGSSTNFTCEVCGMGRYQYMDNHVKTACDLCTPGTWGSWLGGVNCMSCPDFETPAQWQPAWGATTCLACTTSDWVPGRSQCGGTDVREQCGEAQYTDSTIEGCTVCQAGRYNPAEYAYTKWTTACLECQPGKYSEVGSVTCTDCALGRYQAFAGRSACDACPGNTVAMGQSTCSSAIYADAQCAAGEYVDESNNGLCTPCAAGTYQPVNDSNVNACTLCTNGTYQSSTGASSCDPCPTATTLGHAECPPVPSTCATPGSYLDINYGCRLCSIGHYQPPWNTDTNVTSCEICSAGQYNPIIGMTYCSVCAHGRYRSIQGATVCLTCESATSAAATTCNGLPEPSDDEASSSSSSSSTGGSSSGGDDDIVLVNNVPRSDTITVTGAALYYSFIIGSVPTVVRITVAASTGDPDLYVRIDGVRPTTTSYDYASDFGGSDSLVIPPGCTNCRYSIMVYAYYATQYIITASRDSDSTGGVASSSTGSVPSTSSTGAASSSSSSSTGNSNGGFNDIVLTPFNYQQAYWSSTSQWYRYQLWVNEPSDVIIRVRSLGSPYIGINSNGHQVPWDNPPLPAQYRARVPVLNASIDVTISYNATSDLYDQYTCSQCWYSILVLADPASVSWWSIYAQIWPISRSNAIDIQLSIYRSQFDQLMGTLAVADVSWYRYALFIPPTIVPGTNVTVYVMGFETDIQPYLFATTDGVTRVTASNYEFRATSDNGRWVKLSIPFAAGCSECAWSIMVMAHTDNAHYYIWAEAQVAPSSSSSSSTGGTVSSTGTTLSSSSTGPGIGMSSSTTGVPSSSTVFSSSSSSSGSSTGDVGTSTGPNGDGDDTGGDIICTYGEYVNGTCTKCDPGSFQSAVVSTVTACTSCYAGSYAAEQGSYTCYECNIYTYQPERGASTCLTCYGAVTFGMTYCPVASQCEQGQYLAVNANNSAETRCINCPPGQFQASETYYHSETSCTNCSPGSYTAFPAFTYCLQCLPGFYQPNEGGDTCVSCGTVTTVGATICPPATSCGGGEYLDEVTDECATCPPGTMNPEPVHNKTYCDECPPGFYSDGQPVPPWASHYCSVCPLASYQPLAGASSCLDCNTSYWFAATECLPPDVAPCNFGYYRVEANETCQPCAAGTYQPVFDQLYPECIPCPVNWYNDHEAAYTCKYCPYAMSEGMTDCPTPVSCPQGYYKLNTTIDTCLPCPPGTFSPQGGVIAICSPCFVGTYQPNSGASSCDDCNTAISISMSECPYSPVLCQPGEYFVGNTSSPELSECVACPAGTWSNRVNHTFTSCFQCGLGLFGPYPGATTPQCFDFCPPGTYNPNYGATACLECASAYYYGAMYCDTPTGGGSSSSTGVGVPPSLSSSSSSTGTNGNNEPNNEPCNYGYYRPVANETCVSCPIGHYQPTPNQQFPECIPCPAHSYQDTLPASYACKYCATATSTATGMTYCPTPVLCSYGQYLATVNGANSCADCPAGTYTDQYRHSLSTCFQCPAGSYQSMTGTYYCLSCTPDTYQPMNGSASCLPCIGATWGATTCTSGGGGSSSTGVGPIGSTGGGVWSSTGGVGPSSSTGTNGGGGGSTGGGNGGDGDIILTNNQFYYDQLLEYSIYTRYTFWVSVTQPSDVLITVTGLFPVNNQPLWPGMYARNDGADVTWSTPQFASTPFSSGNVILIRATDAQSCTNCRYSIMVFGPGAYRIVASVVTQPPSTNVQLQPWDDRSQWWTGPSTFYRYSLFVEESSYVSIELATFISHPWIYVNGDGRQVMISDRQTASQFIDRAMVAGVDTNALVVTINVPPTVGNQTSQTCINCYWSILIQSDVSIPDPWYQVVGRIWPVRSMTIDYPLTLSPNLDNPTYGCLTAGAGVSFHRYRIAVPFPGHEVYIYVSGYYTTDMIPTVYVRVDGQRVNQTFAQRIAANGARYVQMKIPASSGCRAVDCQFSIMVTSNIDYGRYSILVRSQVPAVPSSSTGTNGGYSSSSTGVGNGSSSSSTGTNNNNGTGPSCSTYGQYMATAINGTMYCTWCAAGTYQSATHHSLTSCSACSVGSYTPYQGSGGCLPCATATSQGMSYCPPSTSSTGVATGSSSSTGGNTGGVPKCTSVGQYVTTAPNGTLYCTWCPAGSYQSAIQHSLTSCSLCTPGTYTGANQFFASQCIPCPQATYQPNYGGTSCLACTASGSWTGAATCPACPLGTYLVVNTTNPDRSTCVACLPGTYQPTNGHAATRCLQCQAGTYQLYPGYSYCSLCSAYTYQPNNGSTTCLTCSSQPMYGSVDCPPKYTCDYGEYKNATTGVCTSCPAGTENPYYNHNKTSCNLCRPGTFNRGGSPSQGGYSWCDSCRPYSYSPSYGATSCMNCSTAYSYEATQCLPPSQAACTYGYYRAMVNESCVACPAGTFQQWNNLQFPVCEPCGISLYQDTPGSSYCKYCETATSTTTGMTYCPPSPVVCSPGWYSVNGTYPPDGYCLPCEAGSYGNGGVNASCILCAIGSYAANSGSGACTYCGTAMTQGLTQCPYSPVLCQAGQYFDGITSSSSCVACPAGTSSYYVNHTFTSCGQCQPGTYSSSTGAQYCNYCYPGYYQPNYGATSCLVCSTNYYAYASTSCSSTSSSSSSSSTGVARSSSSSSTGVSFSSSSRSSSSSSSSSSTGVVSGVTCGIGEYVNVWVQQCVVCPVGSYQALSSHSSTSCIPCPAGYTSSSNHSSCNICPAFTYSPYAGYTGGCLYCQWAYMPGASSCIAPACGIGFYYDVYVGACRICDMGTHQPSPTSYTQDCYPCTPGRYASLPGSANCTSCPIQSYQPGYGSSVCLSCPTLFITGSASCPGFTCGAGEYRVSNGVCSSCAAGRYQPFDNTIVTSCSLCSPGSYTSMIGSTSCQSCNIHSYQPSFGGTSCLNCNEVNITSSYTCPSVPIICGAGEYVNASTYGGCSSCRAGSSQSLTHHGSTYCESCSPGSYQLWDGQYQCYSCPEHWYQPSSGSITCLYCDMDIPAGTSICVTSGIACSAGTYWNRTSNKCIACNEGTYQPWDNSIEQYCYSCEPGTYSSSIGSTSCTLCEYGSYQPDWNSNECIACSFAHIQGSTQCAPDVCQSGQYYNSVTGMCQSCGIGTYQPYSNVSLSSCYPCQPGTYESFEGSSLCSLCGIESYQPSFGSGSCLYCASITQPYQIGATICSSANTTRTCSQGQYLNVMSDNSQCVSCPIGRYQPFDNVAVTDCYYCQPGTYGSSIIGSSGNNCASCDIGTYQPSYGSSSCLECESSTTYGAITCSINTTTSLVCGTGQYLDLVNNQCEWCHEGTYQPFTQSRLPSCLTCLPGTYAPSIGNAVCLLCPIQSYSSSFGSDSCLSCPSVTVMGASSCPTNNHTTPSNPSTTKCAAGSYSIDGYTSSGCTLCGHCSYQPYNGMTSCLSCSTVAFNGSTVCYSGAPLYECSPLVEVNEPTKNQSSVHTNHASSSTIVNNSHVMVMMVAMIAVMISMMMN